MEEINQEEEISQKTNQQEHSVLNEHKSRSNDEVYEDWKRYIESKKKNNEDNIK